MISVWECALFAAPAEHKSATYIAVLNGETDTLHLTVVPDAMSGGGYRLFGFFEVIIKQSGGELTSKRILIRGDVSTDGVPSSITFPSSVIGVPDLTLGCFFDESLNLHLVGDNTRSFPHFVCLVK